MKLKFQKLEVNKSVIVKKLSAYCFCLLLLFSLSCSEFEKPKPEKFYADSVPPMKQEFRWSNGDMPKSFDPAKASAPPETDIVRAIYDGLTETETKNLKPIPSIASKWTSSEDHKVWTFQLRQDAKWSNGDTVTANDFVRSWKRLARLGDEVPHYELLKNIVGMSVEEEASEKQDSVKENKKDIFSIEDATKNLVEKSRTVVKPEDEKEKPENKDAVENKENVFVTKPDAILTGQEANKKQGKPIKLGVKAIGKHKLEVTLVESDKSFPALVAHPIFRPVFANGDEFKDEKLNANIITNGAFRIFSVGKDGITLDKAEYYYNKENVKLQRVRFVPIKDAETALKAYKNGDVDAVTNAKFEPLALKILAPYVDFKKETHSAINLYEFNRKKEPFNDRRVRQALSISIDRKRLTDDEMEGTSKPAHDYLPFNSSNKEEKSEAEFAEDIDKAKELLRTAGYKNGEGFPKIKLVINRNNVQQKIAKSVAKMWKQNLNVETEVIVKEFDELETSKESGEYDLIRRGVVLPTSDETANMLAIFSPKKKQKNIEPKEIEKKKTAEKKSEIEISENSNINLNADQKSEIDLLNNSNINNSAVDFEEELKIDTGEDEKVILTEEEAVLEVPAIPLYFPTSYSLVKPYVEGFEINTLDAPLLKDVRIDNNWQPEKIEDES